MSASVEPSTAWEERIDAGERERFEEAAARLAAMQRAKSQKYGKGRALHRKQVAALKATLEVLPGLPPYAAHGLFAAAGRYDAWVRLSNGSMNVASDRTPDIRGFAVKVFCPEGEAALGGTTSSQDLLLIDRPVFGFVRPEPFFDLVLAAGRGVLPVIWLFVKTNGPLAGLARLRALQQARATPFTGFLTETFWSAAPLACGPYACRARLKPEKAGASEAPAKLSADVEGRVASEAYMFRLELQFFVDEASTPIEDGTVDWNEAVAPFIPVARLTVPSQDLTTEEGRQFSERVAAAMFDPWSGLAAHRPLGAIMRARAASYLASQRERDARR